MLKHSYLLNEVLLTCIVLVPIFIHVPYYAVKRLGYISDSSKLRNKYQSNQALEWLKNSRISIAYTGMYNLHSCITCTPLSYII